MRVTVIGASGRIGRRIVAEAVSRGHEVVAAVRDPAVSNVDFNGRVVGADVFDPAAVAEAVAGCDVVVSAVGHAA
ncbi:MAG TPA: NAD(P)H-binding protein, partial [Micromonosporaceae bacterium]|nr:NAD(P)H-binding protein [Micromonosporaceae bacterium]